MAGRGGRIELNEKEAPRPGVMESLRAGLLTQREVADQLDLSVREVQRLANSSAPSPRA